MSCGRLGILLRGLGFRGWGGSGGLRRIRSGLRDGGKRGLRFRGNWSNRFRDLDFALLGSNDPSSIFGGKLDNCRDRTLLPLLARGSSWKRELRNGKPRDLHKLSAAIRNRVVSSIGNETYRCGKSGLHLGGGLGLPLGRRRIGLRRLDWHGGRLMQLRLEGRCWNRWRHGRLQWCRGSWLHGQSMRWEVVWRHDGLRGRIRGYNHWSIRWLKRTRRKLHVAIGRVPRRELLRRVRRGHMAIHTVHVWRVSHVRWGAHVGRTRVVRKILLPSRRRHLRLPVGHRRQVVVHLDQTGRGDCLSQFGRSCLN